MNGFGVLRKETAILKWGWIVGDMSVAARMMTLSLMSVGLSVNGALAGEPFIPSDDGVVIERLTSAVVAARSLRARVQTRAGETPVDLDSALKAATAHLQLARAESDPRQHGYAQAALSPWWTLADPPLEVLVVRAIVHQARHQFDLAIEDLDRVLAQDGQNAQALLTRSTVLRVQGKRAAAREQCKALGAVVHPLVTTTCICATASSRSQMLTAYRALNKAILSSGATSSTIRQWAYTVLGELAQALGEVQHARSHYLAGLRQGPRNVYLLAAFADLLLDEGRAKDVRDLLHDDTGPDGLLLRLALAERMLGDTRFRQHSEQLKDRFQASERRGDDTHLRDAARAALVLDDRPEHALEQALRSWQQQREVWDARLVLESALALGTPQRARPVLQWLDAQRIEHVRLTSLRKALEDVGRG